ncbi:MAG: hypothetical protein AAGD25_22125 [Cyanobacteria bacterium P01_F01_bin.150]
MRQRHKRLLLLLRSPSRHRRQLPVQQDYELIGCFNMGQNKQWSHAVILQISSNFY